MIVGAILHNLFKVRFSLLVYAGLVLMLFGVTIGMSAGFNFKGFEFMFTTFFGIGAGIMMILSLEILWEHFYTSRGPVTGFVYFAKYFGTFFFSMIA